jgi:NitT/TauT family transport system ATP-binding protein
LGKE